MKTDKKIKIEVEHNRFFTVDAHEVIDHRSKYYADKDSDTSYQEEYDYLLSDDYEVTDWLTGNMDWYECKTLIELTTKKTPVSDLEVIDMDVIEASADNVQRSSGGMI